VTQEVIIFTDLDGTLLEHGSYGVRSALPAVDLLVRRGIPVIPVSSKTASELRRWIWLLTLEGPFICENGCGIVFPEEYLEHYPGEAVLDNGEWRISLGPSTEMVKKALHDLSREMGFQYRSLSQMSLDEVADLTGLAGEELFHCLEREFDEPFILLSEHDIDLLEKNAREKGLYLTRGGRFFHLTGGCNKGDAVRKLSAIYKGIKKDPIFVAIGDSYNDLPMFRAVDLAFLVQRPDGTFDPMIPQNEARRVCGAGPKGWRLAVEEVMTFG